MPTEQFANNAQTTLAAAVTAGATTITVSAVTGFPAGPRFRVRVGDELMLVTAVAGTTWTVTRGAEGTTAAAHAAGDSVTQVLTAGAVAALAEAGGAGGRLTLTSGTPVTTTDVAGATTLYYTPAGHDRVGLWDGTGWASVQFAEKALALGTLIAGRNYDVFGYLAGGDLALELVAWTGDTARATGVSLQDGRYCKAGDKTRLYLGTFRTTSATTTADTKTQRFVWNTYNRTRRPLFRGVVAGGRPGTGAAWAVWLGSTSHRLEVVVGVNDSPVEVALTASGTSTAGSSTYFGIALDTTSTPSGVVPLCGGGSIPYYQTAVARFRDFVGAGYHYLQALEWGLPAASFGGDGLPGPMQGMDGFLMG